MRYKLLILFSASIIACFLSYDAKTIKAQTTEVKEHKIEVDSASGKVTTTTAVIEKTEEETFTYTDMLNINPLKFFLAYNLMWMHKLSSNTAAGIGFELPTMHGNSGYDQTGWGVLAEFRFYPSKKSMHGFYIAPNVTFTQVNNVPYYSLDQGGLSNPGTYTANTFSAGLLAGWQWYPATDFSMGFAFGVDDYFLLNQKGTDYNFNLFGGLYGKGTSPTVRFDLGYVW